MKQEPHHLMYSTRINWVVVIQHTEHKADGHHAPSGDGLQEPQDEEDAEPRREAGADPSQHLQCSGQHQWRLSTEPVTTNRLKRKKQALLADYCCFICYKCDKQTLGVWCTDFRLVKSATMSKVSLIANFLLSRAAITVVLNAGLVYQIRSPGKINYF